MIAALAIFGLGFLMGCVCCGWSPRFLDAWAERREMWRRQATEDRILDSVNRYGNSK